MGRFIVSLLCLWSCITTVAPMTEFQLEGATNYIKDTLRVPMDNKAKQYAYAVLFTKDECKKLSTSHQGLQILKSENAADIAKAFADDNIIYQGKQMVLATFKKKKDPKDKNEHDIHSEYRLLFPPPGSNVSPVENMMNKNPDKGCAIFYTLNSPCVGVCTNTKHDDNIIPKLSVFSKVTNAFVYSQLYEKDISGTKVTKDNIWNGLVEISKQMDVVRCFSKKCLDCFFYDEKNKKYVNKGNCIN